MKVDITRQNFISALLLFTALCLVLWHRYTIAPIEVLTDTTTRMPLGELLHGWGEILPAPLRNLIAFGMLFIGSIWIMRLTIRNMILLEHTYIPITIFLTIGCGSWFDPVAFDLFTATLLMTISFNRMIDSFSREVVYTRTFNASLLLGVALLTYAPVAVYVPLLLISLAHFRKRWREWIIALTGLILPIAICSYVWWALGRPLMEIPIRLWEILCDTWYTPAFLVHWLNPLLLLFWALITALTVWSFVIFILQVRTMRRRPYKSYIYSIWILLFSLPPLILPSRSIESLTLLAIPLTIIISICFNLRKSIWPSTVYLLLLVSMIAYNLFPIPF